MATGCATEQNNQASLKWDGPIISCQCQKEDTEDIQLIELQEVVTLMAAVLRLQSNPIRALLVIVMP